MIVYRAEATRKHRGPATSWKGKWRRDPSRAVAQAKRWRVKEPFAEITIARSNGMKATLEELESALASGKPK
jgi:hypothetical protein